jgi:hypothetical protein
LALKDADSRNVKEGTNRIKKVKVIMTVATVRKSLKGNEK